MEGLEVYLIDVSAVDGDSGIEEMVSAMEFEDSRKRREELPEEMGGDDARG